MFCLHSHDPRLFLAIGHDCFLATSVRVFFLSGFACEDNVFVKHCSQFQALMLAAAVVVLHCMMTFNLLFIDSIVFVVEPHMKRDEVCLRRNSYVGCLYIVWRIDWLVVRTIVGRYQQTKFDIVYR